MASRRWAIAASTPSIFDTLGWFNAVAIYLAGIVAAVGTAAWLARVAARERPLRRYHTFASLLIGLVASGFTELVALVIALGSLLAIATAHDLLPKGPRKRSIEQSFAAVGIGAGIAVIVIFLGPGSRTRAQLQHSSFALSHLVSAVRMNIAWADTDVGWRALLSVACGLSVLHFRRTAPSPRAARWLLLWALFLWFVPILVGSLAVGYGGGVVASRQAVVATAAIAAGLAVMVYVIAAAASEAIPTLTRVVLPVAVIGAAIGLVGFFDAAVPVVRAELLRRSVVDARALSVRRQLHDQRGFVRVMPAPLIDDDESAIDLGFERRQVGWVLAAIRSYYDIPSAVAIRVITRQPDDYCLSHVSVKLFNVKSCEQLAASRRS